MDEGWAELQATAETEHLVLPESTQLHQEATENLSIIINVKRRRHLHPQGRISRWHARLLLENEVCFVEDRCADPGSSLAKITLTVGPRPSGASEVLSVTVKSGGLAGTVQVVQ